MTPQTLNDLTPAPYNPRVITEKSFKGLQTSVSEFGDLSGIVFNVQTGHLVSGHQRVNALKAAGVFNILVDNDNKNYVEHNGERFYIRYVQWTEEKEKLANVTANNPQIQGKWSDEIGVVLDEIVVDNSPLLADLQIPTLLHSIGIHRPDEQDEEPEPTKTKETECPNCGHVF